MINKEIEEVKLAKEILKKHLEPLKDIPFHWLGEIIWDQKIVEFKNNSFSEELKSAIFFFLSTLKKEGETGKEIRINEKGNKIEKQLRDFLIKENIAIPILNNKGKGKSTGYPDILLKDKEGNYVYLEIKLSQLKNKKQTTRIFYVSKGKTKKVNNDGAHLLLNFYHDQGEIKEITLYDLYNLKLKLKPELNASYKDISDLNDIWNILINK